MIPPSSDISRERKRLPALPPIPDMPLRRTDRREGPI
jgi:hypothetical protein